MAHLSASLFNSSRIALMKTANVKTSTLNRSSRIPRHIGIIPDGNRRWARQRGMAPGEGYAAGIEPGLNLLHACRRMGVKEVSIYGFTQENVRRPKEQVKRFCAACVSFVEVACAEGFHIRVFGDSSSSVFPAALLPLTRPANGSPQMKVNLLVNYGWNWDLRNACRATRSPSRNGDFTEHLATARISRIDLIIRWGGRRRLSGFLPVQSVYADFFVLDEFWPDFQMNHFDAALDWYSRQDVTLGG